MVPQRLHLDLRLLRQPFRVHELHEAARAVAALLHLAAVGIEDAVAEVRRAVVRLLHHQDLVAADAAVAVCDFFQLNGIKRERLAGEVQHDKIVARAMHLGERELHAALRTQAAMRSIDASSSSGLIGSERTVRASFSATGRDELFNPL